MLIIKHDTWNLPTIRRQYLEVQDKDKIQYRAKFIIENLISNNFDDEKFFSELSAMV